MLRFRASATLTKRIPFCTADVAVDDDTAADVDAGSETGAAAGAEADVGGTGAVSAVKMKRILVCGNHTFLLLG
jgi:hypothetical protein